MEFPELLINFKQLTSSLTTQDELTDSMVSEMQSIHDELVPTQPTDGRNGYSSGPDFPSASELRKENKQLHAHAAEQETVLDLIMSKYRATILELSSAEGLTKKLVELIAKDSSAAVVDGEALNKMKSLMKKSIGEDDKSVPKEEELISRLRTENRGLRELLQIAGKYGSLSDDASGD